MFWNAVNGATGYNIYRSLSSSLYANSLLKVINSGSTITYTDTGTAVTIGTPAALDISNQTLYLSGSGVANDGALKNIAGNNTWAGNVVLASVPGYSTATSPQGWWRSMSTAATHSRSRAMSVKGCRARPPTQNAAVPGMEALCRQVRRIIMSSRQLLATANRW